MAEGLIDHQFTTKFTNRERMGRKGKRGAIREKKGGRDGEKAAPPADDDCASSSDGEGGAAAAGLPMANLVRLIRQVIPKGVKVSTRAKHLTHDCAVEFVGFVAGEAAEQAKAQHRRTIAPEDFICAFQALGFDDYVQPMSTYTRRYHEHHNNAARGYRGSFVPRPPPPPPDVAVAEEAAVTAPGVPCFSDEEMQYLRSTVPSLHGEQDDEGSSSAYSPTPAGHGYGYTGDM
nr:nuclear transcription factor Y subunit B-1-like [Setaria viridis]